MPRLTFRGLSAEQIAAIEAPLTAELADICRTGAGSFTIELLHTTEIAQGRQTAAFPFVEVGWFERGKETRDRFAKAVSEHVLRLGIAEMEVVFTVYAKESYYANGVPFA